MLLWGCERERWARSQPVSGNGSGPVRLTAHHFLLHLCQTNNTEWGGGGAPPGTCVCDDYVFR